MMSVAIDPGEARSVISKPVKHQVARAVFVGAFSAAGVVTLSAAALTIFVGVTAPVHRASVSSEAASQSDFEARTPLSGDRGTAGPAQPEVSELPVPRPLVLVDRALASQAASESPLNPASNAGALLLSPHPLSRAPFGPTSAEAAKAEPPPIADVSAAPPERQVVPARSPATKAQTVLPQRRVTRTLRPLESPSTSAPARKEPPVKPPRISAVSPPYAAKAVRVQAAAGDSAARPSTLRSSKPAAVHTKTAIAAAAVTTAPSQPSPAAQAAGEAEPEVTEVFGLKLLSLAPAGRKIRESVEALGDAVKSLPASF